MTVLSVDPVQLKRWGLVEKTPMTKETSRISAWLRPRRRPVRLRKTLHNWSSRQYRMELIQTHRLVQILASTLRQQRRGYRRRSSFPEINGGTRPEIKHFLLSRNYSWEISKSG